ncbi:amino acid ABC transporter substrate-binding protein [Elongatibacter sediminis]|uniref:Amino acid ABC transporter substrate-binding protein n=1 Tax=Elongatibacter sediminis TaxID=3119006 RepID=A0AAW9RBT4_9GAMM
MIRQRALPRLAALLLAFIAAPFAGTLGADTLDEVRQRGYLKCGITESGVGFSYLDANGQRAGFEVDHCKTIAAAVFGELKVEYVLATPQTGFTLLQSGAIDLFPAGATWSYLRDTSLGLDYAGIYFYDGQGFMVRKRHDVKTVTDLANATFCVAQGTTLEQNLADFFDSEKLDYELITFADTDKALEAYQADRCDALTMQRAALATRMSGMADRDDHHILDETISSEPQGPLVRQNDSRWRDIVWWSFNARLLAELHGISQANVERVRAESGNREVQRLLGVYGDFGQVMGLDNDWAYDIIRLVGSYADVWDRNLAPIGLQRGPNRLWRDGGLMFALPFR